MVTKNRIGYGIIYLQISRGVARRDPAFPSPQTAPTVVATARPLKMHATRRSRQRVSPLSVYRTIAGGGSTSRPSAVANVLARQAALDAGARDAWFVDKDGKVTEAASANAWIVTPAGTLVTRQADHAILRGITRGVSLDVVKAQGLTVEERGFTLEEAYAAREAFETSATQIVMPVVSIDGHKIADGKPGPVAKALRREFHRFAEAG